MYELSTNKISTLEIKYLQNLPIFYHNICLSCSAIWLMCVINQDLIALNPINSSYAGRAAFWLMQTLNLAKQFHAEKQKWMYFPTCFNAPSKLQTVPHLTLTDLIHHCTLLSVKTSSYLESLHQPVQAALHSWAGLQIYFATQACTILICLYKSIYHRAQAR